MRCLFVALLATAGCSAARVLGPPIPVIEDRLGPTTVVIEPFFENADWKVTTTSERATVFGTYGNPQDVYLSREVAQKPVFARVPVLMSEHAAVLTHLRQLRPQ